MKICSKCPTILYPGSVLITSEEIKRGLCNSCYEKALKYLREKFPEGRRESLMDDFIAPVDLKGEK